MALVILLMAGIYAISYSSTSIVHPTSIALLTGAEPVDLDCRPAAGAGTSLESPSQNRATVFRLSGTFDCHRSIFTADERDPFIERLLAAESKNAKRVAIAVHARLGKQSSSRPVVVVVDGEAGTRVHAAVEAVYRNELANTLPPGRLSHLSLPTDDSAVVAIRVRHIDAADLMTRVRISTGDLVKGARQWHAL